MKFATFKADGTATWGLIDGEEAIDLGTVLRDRYPDLKSAIAANALHEAAERAGDAKRYPLSKSSGSRSFPIRTRSCASD